MTYGPPMVVATLSLLSSLLPGQQRNHPSLLLLLRLQPSLHKCQLLEVRAEAVTTVVMGGGPTEETEEIQTPTTITKIVSQIILLIKIVTEVTNLIRRALEPVRMFPTTRAAATGKKVEMRPTAPTPSSAAGCTSSPLVCPEIERSASLK